MTTLKSSILLLGSRRHIYAPLVVQSAFNTANAFPPLSRREKGMTGKGLSELGHGSREVSKLQ